MEIIENEASQIQQDGYTSVYDIYGEIYSNLKQYDNSLYRVEKANSHTSNDAIIYETYGVTSSTSTFSQSTYDFLRNMGIQQSHVHVTYNAENTKACDMLLGIKYIISTPNNEILKNYIFEYEDGYLENKAKVYKNPYCLSLGYGVNSEIFDINMNNDNTFQVQNTILKSSTGINENVYEEHKGKINKSTMGIELVSNIYKNIADDAKITYEFEIENTNNVYVYFIGVSDDYVKIYINDEEWRGNDATFENETINLGKRNLGEKIKIDFIPKGYTMIDNFYVYYENEEVLKKHYDILSRNQVDITKINNCKFEGTYIAKENNQYILFTIPYEDGWRAYVDGEEVNIEKALEALISVKIDEGVHQIKLVYTLPKIYIGLVFSIIGILVFVLICSKEKRIVTIFSKKEKNYCKKY